MPSVAVVGSINEDVVVDVPHLPSLGETVIGSHHFSNPGGKGANQAVAAARLGASVALVGRVGNDETGLRMLSSLSQADVDTQFVSQDPELPTGLAVITVDREGQNVIAVSSGANRALQPSLVSEAESVLRAADVVLVQLEIPMMSVRRAAALAAGTVILNPAPARTLPGSLLENVDVLIPNAVELGLLLDRGEASSASEALTMAAQLEDFEAVVVTLGAAGAVVVASDVREHVPAPKVNAVDTTAAGDAFCGAFAVRWASGGELLETVRFAVAAGAATALRAGAQPSLPEPSDVASLLPDEPLSNP